MTDRNELALLFFYPMGFSLGRTAELCSIRCGAWFDEITSMRGSEYIDEAPFVQTVK